jgi:signal recognition particle GTPase
MFKQLFGGVQEAVERLQGASEDTTRDVRSTDVAAGREAAKKEAGVISDIDNRAVSGKVTFDDFLKVGRTFKQMGGKVPGMPGTLTDEQVQDTLKKFELHEKIVAAMTDKERSDPQILMDDVANTDENCPLIQRVAKDSGCAEKDVALFMADFEAMRQSTQRIADGEDPDAVNADIGSSNRAQRRMLKQQKKKGKRR